MGTRNLTCVMLNKEYKIAQYGQWDGDPSGQGVTILSFLKGKGNISKLRESLKRVRFLEGEGKDKEFLNEYDKNAPKWSNDPDNRTEEQKQWFSVYISRNIAGEILENIVNSDDKEIVIRNNIGFAGDSLMCEYAYVVDLDENVFEIYEGFNKDVITKGRFISNSGLEESPEYEPIKLVKIYNLDELPEREAFLSDLESKEVESGKTIAVERL